MTARVLVLLAVALSLSGCAATDLETAYQSRLIDTADVAAVRREAEVVLRREFPRLTASRGGDALTSDPIEYRASSASGSARDLVGAPSRLRRIATFSLAPQGERTVARLRVDIERQESRQAAAFQSSDARLSDSPAQSAIERDAATTERQNEVWVRVRRDRELERALLEDIQSRFAAEAAVASRPTTQTTPPAPRP
ncbi:MAG: hypothetical protein U1D55_12580 [Phycisphaerae bacterium]